MNYNLMQRIEELRKANSKTPSVTYKCKVCRDSGMIESRSVNGNKYYKECICIKRAKIQKQWERLGMTKANLKTFDNFESNTPALNIIKTKAIQYANCFKNKKMVYKPSFLVFGRSGGGKTHLCKAIANVLINNNVMIEPLIYREDINTLKQFIMDSREYASKLDRYKNAEVLYIDDLFKGSSTESEIKIMFELIDFRYRHSLPMVISTELTLTQLISIDEALATRIQEMCKEFIVYISPERFENYRNKTTPTFSEQSSFNAPDHQKPTFDPVPDLPTKAKIRTRVAAVEPTTLVGKKLSTKPNSSEDMVVNVTSLISDLVYGFDLEQVISPKDKDSFITNIMLKGYSKNEVIVMFEQTINRIGITVHFSKYFNNILKSGGN